MVSDPKKGEFYVAVIEKPGRATIDVLAEVLPAIVRGFPWPKSMRWGEGSLRWVRPLHSIVATFGPETEDPEVVPFEVDGIKAGNVTYGHRFLAPGPITVRRWDDYLTKLEAAKVVADPERRKAMILPTPAIWRSRKASSWWRTPGCWRRCRAWSNGRWR